MPHIRGGGWEGWGGVGWVEGESGWVNDALRHR